MGGVISDLRHDFVRTIACRTSKLDFRELNNTFEELEKAANQMLGKENIAQEDRYFKRSLDMRYKGQFHEVNAEVPNGLLGPEQLTETVNRFHEAHESLYGYRDIVETEIMNTRLVGYGRVVQPSVKEQLYAGKDARKYFKGKRDVFFQEAGGFIATSVYDGDKMVYGNSIEGPAVVEQRTTTIVVPPRSTLEVARYGDFVMHLE
jgi:N-methylhydantoinase A